MVRRIRPFALGRALRPASLLACALGAACASDPDTATGPDTTTPTVTISLAPATLDLAVGETATITASVSGTTESPTFTSSAPDVASVSASGASASVTAVGQGPAEITASVAGQSATTAVTVTAPAEATITGIMQDGETVDLEDVSGVVEVGVEYDVPEGFVGTIEVTLGGLVAGSLPIGPGSPAPVGSPALRVSNPVATTVHVATTRVDEALDPLFLNGQSHSLGVRILDDEASEVYAQDSEIFLTPNNPPVFILSDVHAAPGPARSEGIRRGEIDLIDLYETTLYGSARGSVQWVDFAEEDDSWDYRQEASLEARGNTDLTLGLSHQDGAPGYEAFFDPHTPPPAGAQGVEDIFAALTVRINPTTGEPASYPVLDGTGSGPAQIVIDNRPPRLQSPFQFDPPRGSFWVNNEFSPRSWARVALGLRYGPLESDPTVEDLSGADCRFLTGSDPDNLELFTPQPQSDLPIYYLEIECFDPGDNIMRSFLRYSNGLTLPYGVDNVPPGVDVLRGGAFIESYSVNSDATHLGFASLNAGASGTAGFRFGLRRTHASGTECLTPGSDGCGTYSEADADGRLDVDVGQLFGPLDGAWNADVRAVDGAGNESDPLNHPFVFDRTAPRLLDGPSRLGDTYLFNASDNVSIGQWTAWRLYGDSDLKLGIGRRRASVPFAGDLAPVGPFDFAFLPDIETVEMVGDAPAAPTGVVAPWTDLRVEVTDWDPENRSGASLANPAPALRVSYSGGILVVRLLEQSADEIVNDIGGTYDGPDPEELTLKYEILTPLASAPFRTDQIHMVYKTPTTTDGVAAWADVWAPADDPPTDMSVTSVTQGGSTTHTYSITISGRHKVGGEHEGRPIFVGDDGRGLVAPPFHVRVRFEF